MVWCLAPNPTPHVRDLLSSNDRNYQVHESRQEDVDQDQSEPEMEDAMDMPMQDLPNGTEDSSPLSSPQRMFSMPSRQAAPSTSTGTPSSRPKRGLPLGVTPQVISSSETSQCARKGRAKSTIVQYKNLSGHNVIAEATKATGIVMAQHMQDIAESSRDLKRSKIEVQLKLFTEKMCYQQEKDRRLHENALMANENTRLSILKQAEMVSCLANLSNVLSSSFIKNNGQAVPSTPQTATKEDNTPISFCSPTPMQNASQNCGTSCETHQHRSQSKVPTGDTETELQRNETGSTPT